MRYFLKLPDAELQTPIWRVPVADRSAFLSARTRRAFSRWKATAEDGEAFHAEAMERVTDFADSD